MSNLSEPEQFAARSTPNAPVRIAVHVFDLDNPDHDRGIAALSADEHERAERFRFERDRLRYQRGRATVRQVLGETLDITPHAIRFAYGPQGKPSLTDSQCFFNLAHCDALAVLAVSDHELGIDVELDRDGFANDTIAERFFAPAEILFLRALPPHEQRAAFFRCWTRKEAYLKALGGGLSIPLDDFTVDFSVDGPARIVWIRDAPGEPNHWTIVDCSAEVSSNATCAIATRGAVVVVDVSRR